MTNTIDWTELTAFARHLARESAKAILPYFRGANQIDIKPGVVWDPVTEADRAGERVMRKLIEEHFPDHGIHGEEYGVREGKGRFNWILDPVDGTRAFICGMPTWTTLIGLNDEGKPKVGVMNQPYVGESFFGNPEGAWCDYRGETRQLRTRPARPLKETIFGTTAPELYRNDTERRILAALSGNTRLTRYGGDAYFFCLVAAGQMDLAVDAHMMPYDIAPLLPIIEGAGGCAMTWERTPAAGGGDVAAAGSQQLLEEVIDLIARTRDAV